MARGQRSMMVTVVLGVGALALLAVVSLGAIWWAADQNLGHLAAQQRRVLDRVGKRSRAALASIQRSNAKAMQRASRASSLLLQLEMRRSAIAAATTVETLAKALGARKPLAKLARMATYLRQLRFGRGGYAFIFSDGKGREPPRLVLHQSAEIEGRPLAEEYAKLAAHLRRVGWFRRAKQARGSSYLAGNRLVELAALPTADGRERLFVVTPLADRASSFVAVADLAGAQRAVLGDVRQALTEAVKASEKTNRELVQTVGVLPSALASSTEDIGQSLLWVSLVLFAFCVSVVALTIVYFQRRLVRPMRRLSGLAESVRDGRYDARAELAGSSEEVQALAASFNQMLDRLVGLIQSDADKQRLEADVVALLDLVSRAAEGDLSVRAQVESAEMASVTDALNHMLESIGRLVLSVRSAAAGVSAAAERIFAASEVMSAGAATQASLLDRTTHKIRALGERSLEINRIVVLVEEIAAQTNVLALNAAIEASRGGGAARGFALVAEEVRKLADRSSNATKDIGAFIDTIHDATRGLVSTMDDIREVTSETVAGVDDTTDSATEMVQATRELETSISRFRLRGAAAEELVSALHERQQELREGVGQLLELAQLARAAGPQAQQSASELLTDLRRQLGALAKAANTSGEWLAPPSASENAADAQGPTP
jgi:methyl-accepting chemotaxis protein